MVSSAGRRPSRWVDRELLGEAIDPWPLLVQTLCSFVDRDRTPRWTGGGPTTGPAVNRWRVIDGTRGRAAGRKSPAY